MEPDMYICLCGDMTESQICEAIKEHGISSIEDLISQTGACSGCQTCKDYLEKVLISLQDD